jgi:hypothetical protein
MKSKQLLAVSIMMLSLQTVHAQGHIKRAFNALITDTSTKVESTNKLNKDPETGTKIGQLDVYEFTIPASHHNLVEDIKQAFDQDKEKAYSLSSVSTANKRSYNYTSLAVGGEDNGYPIGDMKNSRYIYALFLDADDMSKTHRYAYAMEWCERAKEIVGKLIITYATTQEHRRSKRQTRTISVNGRDIRIDGNSFSFGSGFPFDDSSVFDADSLFSNRERSSESWLSEFNTYKNLFLKNPSGTASSHYASYIYKLCKNAKSLDDVEKKMVATEIRKLKDKTKDEFIQNLFDMSIERLKK